MASISASVFNGLAEKLHRRNWLHAAARGVILELPCSVRRDEPAQYLVREGDEPKDCGPLLSGFAYRHKIVWDSGRQIVSIHMPRGSRRLSEYAQAKFADGLGLTPVHINHTLRSLEADGLNRRSKRAVIIDDWKELKQVGDFNTAYLHLDQKLLV